jgi:pyrroloquinoline-quinone synthase
MKVQECSINSEQVIANIKTMIDQSKLNVNEFYKTFRKTKLPLPVLKRIFQQYYYYIRTFPQILSGTAYRVEDEFIRMKLSRTVVSELGDNHGDPHFKMFEKVLTSIGVVLDDWKNCVYIPEAEQLVLGLRNLFLEKPTTYSIGAHCVIEEIGLTMIAELYEGFRQYEGWKVEDFLYFYLHLLIESQHVDWIQDAVRRGAQNPQAVVEIEKGATEVIKLLNSFWKGLNRLAMNPC